MFQVINQYDNNQYPPPSLLFRTLFVFIFSHSLPPFTFSRKNKQHCRCRKRCALCYYLQAWQFLPHVTHIAQVCSLSRVFMVFESQKKKIDEEKYYFHMEIRARAWHINSYQSSDNVVIRLIPFLFKTDYTVLIDKTGKRKKN